jgi:hypothetical protein
MRRSGGGHGIGASAAVSLFFFISLFEGARD